MRQLEELTSVIERLGQATSFETAVDLLTGWSRSYTGCQAAMLRMRFDGEEGDWLGSCSIDGASDSISRDEALIEASECLCGRVSAGDTDAEQPFFTAGGSFLWGAMSTLTSDFPVEQTGVLRGRCVNRALRIGRHLPRESGRTDHRVVAPRRLSGPTGSPARPR